ETRIAGRGRYCQSLNFIGRTTGDSGKVNGLLRSIFIDRNITQNVQGRGLIDRVDRYDEGAGDGVVLCLAFIDAHADGSGTKVINRGREAQAAGCAGATVLDPLIIDETRIAGSGRDDEGLNFISRTRGNSGKIYDLLRVIFIYGDITQRIQ